jgi:hypothetical protein
MCVCERGEWFSWVAGPLFLGPTTGRQRISSHLLLQRLTPEAAPHMCCLRLELDEYAASARVQTRVTQYKTGQAAVPLFAVCAFQGRPCDNHHSGWFDLLPV